MRTRNLNQLGHLRELDAFHACTHKQLQRVDGLLCQLHVEPGKVLCTQGQIGREVFIIVSGYANVTIDDVQVARVGPGSIVGEIAVLDQGHRTATVIADTEMELLAVTPQELNALLIEVPQFTRTMLASLSQRLRLTNRWIGHSKSVTKVGVS